MILKEKPHRKALYFDLSVKALEEHYSQKYPQNGYRTIQHFLVKNNFEHAQYSGYHSSYETTDTEIFKLISKMYDKIPWMPLCVNRFEVTNIGSNHNLIDLFAEEPVTLL